MGPEQMAGEAGGVLNDLRAAVGRLQSIDLAPLTAHEQLLLVREVEVLRRRLDHATDRIAGHVDRTGAYGIDGHRSAKAAVKHLGRLSGGEAHARIRTARALRHLPEVEAAYARGQLPTESVRAIARAASNPRVSEYIPVADPVFAERAATQTHDELRGWLRDWESLADADGAAQDAAQTHGRRSAALLHNAFDGSWTLRGRFGAVQGAALAEVLAAFDDAEFATEWAAVRDQHGEEARIEHMARTPGQRRADAVAAIFRRAASMPDGARTPKPLVNVVIDQETFEAELCRGTTHGSTSTASHDRRADGSRVDAGQVDAYRCQTLGGHRLHPSEAVAAAVAGHVRRVVVDAASNVIDVGRKRRFFTGTSRDAAELQAVLRGRAGLRCLWPGCDGDPRQIDHRDPWANDGRSDVANADPYCGAHNRLKENGFTPVRGPDGTWTIHRPANGPPIVAAA